MKEQIYNFTYLKPKSTEDIFKDKSNQQIKDIFDSSSHTGRQACIYELLRRNDEEDIIKFIYSEYDGSLISKDVAIFFEDKSDSAIQNLFNNTDAYDAKIICIHELLKRNAHDIIKQLRIDYPIIMELILNNLNKSYLLCNLNQ